MLTALLSRADVSRNMQALTLLSELRDAFTARASSASTQTLRFDAPGPSGSTLVRAATLPSVPAYSVTVKAELGQQVARTVLQLHDASTGKLLAVMDAGHLTSLRASVVSALAADVLAVPNAERIALLGGGPVASGAIKALRLVRSLKEVWLFDPDLAKSTEQALTLHASMHTPIHSADTAEEAVAQAQVILLCGGVKLPDVPLQPGAHVSVLGAEEWRHSPVPERLLDRAAARVCDAREPALGWANPFQTELGDVLRGNSPGRPSPDALTLFVATGPAWLDLRAAWHVFEGAKNDERLTRIDLEA